jgi:hypothetical protein
MRRATVALLFALAAPAQDTRVSGPVSGFVFHAASQSIRPIVWVPGSAYLGTAAAQGFDAASVAPLGKFALATQGGQLYLLRGLESGQSEPAPIEGSIDAVDRFAWSPDGASAAVYSGDSRQAQILRNLDRAQPPAVESPLDLSSTDGPVTALAFDGKRLLAGAGGVSLADSSGLKLLLRTSNPAALALGNGDLFVADQASNQVWMIRNYAGEATPMLFADERAGLSAPVGLRVSGNGRSLSIASAGSRSVDALDISTRALLRHVDLDFAPSRMEAVGSSALALLNSGSDGEPLYLLDSGLDSGKDLAVYFVPAGSEE